MTAPDVPVPAPSVGPTEHETDKAPHSWIASMTCSRCMSDGICHCGEPVGCCDHCRAFRALHDEACESTFINGQWSACCCADRKVKR